MDEVSCDIPVALIEEYAMYCRVVEALDAPMFAGMEGVLAAAIDARTKCLRDIDAQWREALRRDAAQGASL